MNPDDIVRAEEERCERAIEERKLAELEKLNNDKEKAERARMELHEYYKQVEAERKREIEENKTLEHLEYLRRINRVKFNKKFELECIKREQKKKEEIKEDLINEIVCKI